MPASCHPDRPTSRPAALRWVFGGLVLAGLAASALASGLELPADLRVLQRWLAVLLPLDQASWALGTVLALSIAGSVLGLPVTLVIALAAMLFGAVPGLLYSLAGCLAGAMIAYAVGCRLDPDGRIVAARPVRRLHARLGQGGLSTVLLLRLFPLLPFTLVNLAAGAIRVRWRDYVIGTALGMLPSIVVLSLLLGRLRPVDAAYTSHHTETALFALLGVLFAAWIGPLLFRRLPGVEAGGAFTVRASPPRISTTPLSQETTSCLSGH